MKRLLKLIAVFCLSAAAFAQTPAPADNLYCPNNTPIWGTADGPATLPLVCYNTALANTPATGATVNVSTAAQLTTALAAAVCGQKITLQAGNVFSGHFTIPALSCPSNNYLWIQTSALSSLPGEGARYATTYNSNVLYLPQFGPCYSGISSLPGRPAFNCPATPGTYTAQLITPDGSPTLNFTSGSSGIRIIGIEITRTAGTGLVSDLTNTGTVALSGIIFDRCWLHGDENQDETKRGLSTDAVSNFAVIDNYFSDLVCISGIGACTDSHAVGGGTNTVNSTTESGIKVVNNFMEASGEPLFFGGSTSNTTPSNIEARLNTFFHPLTWDPSDPSYNGGVSGHPIFVKNCVELKNAQLALLEGNTCQNMWAGFSQAGFAYLLNPSTQFADCPACFVSNITFRYDTVNSACSGMEINNDGTTGFVAAAANNWSIHDLVFDNLGASNLFQCAASSSTFRLASYIGANSVQVIQNVSVNHVTAVYASSAPSGDPIATLGLEGNLAAPFLSNITFTNNVALTGQRGSSNAGGSTNNCAFSSGINYGAPMINACWNPYTFGGNCFVANGSIVWPGTNVTSVASLSAAFVNYNSGNGGNYTLSANACKGAALDGTDPGVNLSALNSVLLGSAPIPPAPTAPPAPAPVFAKNQVSIP